MHMLILDLRFAARRLSKSPGFAATAVLTLALGIAATTSIFSVVEAVLLRPLPFRDPDRLVLIKENVNKLGAPSDLPAPDVLTFAHDGRAFEGVGGFERNAMELSGLGEPMQVTTARLTGTLLSLLGVSPALGRPFTQEEDDHGQPVALISYSLWQGRFNTIVLTAFALCAVLLAILGIYGVIAFSVAQRTREIAVRMALGAQAGGVVRLVTMAGAKLALVASALGIAGAMAISRLLQSLLFQVNRFDPAVFALAAAAVLGLAVLASFLPARHAATIEPMQVLRAE
jgi:hypothetical protein